MSVVCGGQSGLVALLAAALLLGAAPLAHGQEAADLRLETDDAISDADAPAATLKKQTATETIELPVPRRRKPVVDAYAAQGVGSPVFRLYPTLEIGTVASSNAARSAGKKKSDIALRLRPGLSFASNWSRHSWTGTASADFLRFSGTKSASTSTAAAQTALRLDVRRDTRANLDASYSRTAIASGSGEVPLTALGARVDQSTSASFSLEHDVGAFTGQLRLAAQRNVFDDVSLSGGGTEDNSDRDYTEVSAQLRGSLNRGAVLSPYAEVAYEPRWHDRKKDRNGISRNSQGLRLGIGVAIDDGPLWSGELGASVQLRNYADATLANVVAPGVSARLTWRPTDLTRFEFNTGATVAETVAAGSAATRNWNGSVAVVHALRDNVDVTAGLSLSVDKGASGTDWTTTSRLGVVWIANPYLTVNAGYEGTFFNAAAAGANYSEHRILSSIVLKR